MKIEYKSVKEIGELYDISRHMLRRYESYGLIKHTGKNKYGYLYYDEAMVEHIVFIRHLQICGFELPEIGALMKLNRMELRDALIKKVEQLHAQKENIKGIIERTVRIIESIDNHEDLKIAQIIKGEDE